MYPHDMHANDVFWKKKRAPEQAEGKRGTGNKMQNIVHFGKAPVFFIRNKVSSTIRAIQQYVLSLGSDQEGAGKENQERQNRWKCKEDAQAGIKVFFMGGWEKIMGSAREAWDFGGRRKRVVVNHHHASNMEV